jgi:hypothetical protein
MYDVYDFFNHDICKNKTKKSSNVPQLRRFRRCEGQDVFEIKKFPKNIAICETIGTTNTFKFLQIFGLSGGDLHHLQKLHNLLITQLFPVFFSPFTFRHQNV